MCLAKTLTGANAGIQLSNGAASNIIRQNNLSGAWAVGIGFSGLFRHSVPTPGSCGLDQSRRCTTSADCTIPGFGDKGTCVGAGTILVNGRTVNNLAEGNVILGSVLSGIHLGQTIDATVRGNLISGPTNLGINLSTAAMETGVVERNTIRGSANGIGIGLSSAPGPAVGTTITLNDITGYSNAAVLTSNDYNFRTELSLEGKGNYWGLRCPGFDVSIIRKQNGQINFSVKDSYPYGKSVATTPTRSLPATCN